MRETLFKQAAKLKQKNSQHKRWQKVVTALACMVVFCTVYALVLPAITMEQTAYCGKEDYTHSEECYEEQFTCGLEEGAGAHEHTDACYGQEQVLDCQIPESDGHQHGADCYAVTTESVLICEDPEHEHDAGCYETVTVTEETPSCGMTEGEGAHHHSVENGCYKTEPVLNCGQEASDGHQHTDACKGEVCVCQLEEHTHSLACYSDTSADVEDASVWNRTVSSVTLTGDWGKDLAAIAATQTGYTESEKNYAVMEDGTTMNGYTRYGAWAGDAYRDNWSAQFVNFCLSYAGVPSSAIAQKNDCGQWNVTTTDADGNAYVPNAGDLIILDIDRDNTADHAGVVTKASDDDVKAIVGDLDKTVKTASYSVGDAEILGYVEMPEKPTATPTPEATEVPEETPTPEVTEAPEETPTPTPEVTEVPEETPTETPTPEVTLVQNTITVQMYSDSTYETEADDEITITVSGNLPENASVKAYPVENVTMDGEEVLCAWDISIYDAQGNLWEPEEGNNISVEFHMPELTEQEDAEYSIYYIPDEGTDEEPEQITSQVTGNVISFEAEHFSVYAIRKMVRAGNTSSGETNSSPADIKGYITKVSGNGTTYDKNKECYNTDLRIEFSLGSQQIKNDAYSYYYDLPKDVIVPGELLNEDYPLYDEGGTQAGTYSFEKQSDDTYKINVKFYEKYVGTAGNNIHGYISFKGLIGKAAQNEDGKVEVKFNGSYTLIIDPDNIKYDKDETVHYNINMQKTGEYNKETGTLKYTIIIASIKGTPDPLTLNDMITLPNGVALSDIENLTVEKGTVNHNGNGWYSSDLNAGSEGVTISNDKPETSDNSAGKFTLELPGLDAATEDDKCPAYKITYEYKIDKIPTDFQGDIKNKAHVSGEDKTNGEKVSFDAESTISVNHKNTFDKSGYYESSSGEIKWTLKVNENNVDITGAQITDTMFGELSASDLTIDPNKGYQIVKGEGEKISSIKFTQIDNEPNKNSYTITYSKKVENSWTSVSYNNTGTLTPAEGKGDSISKDVSVSVGGGSVSKKVNDFEVNEDKTVAVEWEVSISTPSKLPKGTVISDDFGKNNQYMTVKQVKAWNGTLGFKKSDGTEIESQIVDANNINIVLMDDDDKEHSLSDINSMLDSSMKFTSLKITLKEDLNLPEGASQIFLKYKTTIDVSNANPGVNYYKNEIDVDGKKADATFTYYKGYVKKTDGNGNTSNTKVTDGNILTWKVETGLSTGDAIKTLTITDTLPAGLDLKSLEVGIKDNWNGTAKLENISDGQEIDLTLQDQYTITGKYEDNKDFVITIKDKSDNDLPTDKIFVITYTCEVDKSKLVTNETNEDQISNATFTNNVTVNKDNVKIDSSSQTQEWEEKKPEVKDDTLSKEGSYNNTLQRIDYVVPINPEARDLVQGGDTLELVDELKYKVNYDGSATITGRDYSLIYDSVHLYEGSELKYHEGSVTNTEVENWSWYTETETNPYNNDVTKKIHATIPDRAALILVYSYSVSMENTTNPYDNKNATLSVSNTVELTGTSYKATDDKSNMEWKESDTSGGVTTEKGYTFYKVEEGDFSSVLGGAEFTVYKYDSEQKIFIDADVNYETDANGMFKINNEDHQYASDTAYYIQETKAPSGYKLPDDPQKYYFWFPSDNETKNIPDNFVSEYKPINLTKTSHIEYVTNEKKESNDYTLPETGGIGTNRLTAVGLSLMAGSLMCEYVLRRRRRERRTY